MENYKSIPKFNSSEEIPFWKKSIQEQVNLKAKYLAEKKASDNFQFDSSLYFPKEVNGQIETIEENQARVGRMYNEQLAKVKSSAVPTEEELSAIKNGIEQEAKERQKLLNDIQAADKLVVNCQNFVYPQYNGVSLPNITDGRVMPTEQLFFFTGIPEERLKDVYEYGVVMFHGEKKMGYTGDFTPDGKQQLSNILGKTIEFNDPIVGKLETFTPII